MGSIESSYQDTARKILVERRLINRIEWVRDRTPLTLSPGCAIDASTAVPCDLVAKDAAPPAVPAAERPRHAEPPKDVCEAAPSPATAVATKASGAAAPRQRAALLQALESYTAALAALTKAQDRADFDHAAGKAGAAVSGLTQSVSSATGADAAAPLAGNLAGTSTSLALWLVGQDLDYQRLRELRAATAAACRPMQALAAALGAMLEEQRGDRLDGLHTLLILKVEALGQVWRSSGEAYGAAIDEAEAMADAVEAVRQTDPLATARALRAAHDALVVAVRDGDGGGADLTINLRAFARLADDLAAAAAAKPAG